MNRSLLFLLLGACLLFSGCAKMTTKQDEFPKMYEEQPRSILVLPPMNQTSAADAKVYYSTTIAEPLSYHGYYIFSIPVVTEILQHEGVYDAEMLYNSPVTKLGEHFGADTVLFTKITHWDTVYFVLGGTLTVGFDCELRSTKTNEELWKYRGVVVIDLAGGSSDILSRIVITAINAMATDYVPYARMANAHIYSTMPAGPYSKRHMADGSDKFPDQTLEKE
jgi:hypothetical protein